MSKKERDYWKNFAGNIRQILAFNDAVNTCCAFIKKYGMPNCTIKKVRDTNIDLKGSTITILGYTEIGISDLINQMLVYLESKEEYEKCSILKNAEPVELKVDMSDFLKNASIIVDFTENCDVCWIMFNYNECIPFYGMRDIAPVQDYETLMNILLNHFHDKKEFKKCILLKGVRDEILDDMQTMDCWKNHI